jgi:hypothetical protein
MRSLCVAFTLAAMAAFAQAKTGAPPPMGSGEQQCQMKCAQAMEKCMEPCLPKDPGAADKSGGKNAMAGCAKTCATAQQPCIQKCKKGAGKDKGDKGSDGP